MGKLNPMIERVKVYCAKVLPLAFDNSLSYYETLLHFSHKLNECINAINSQNLIFVEFSKMVSLEIENFEKYIEEQSETFKTEVKEEIQTTFEEYKTVINELLLQMKEEVDGEITVIRENLSRIDSALSAEIANRESGETALNERIEQEENTRFQAIATLNEIITNMSNTFNANWYEEKQNRINGDNEIIARLGGLSFMKLSKAEFDAIPEKDINTIYFVIDGENIIQYLGNIQLSTGKANGEMFIELIGKNNAKSGVFVEESEG